MEYSRNGRQTNGNVYGCSLDLGCAKSIIWPRGRNKEEILQSTRQVHLTKDHNRLTKLAKENDVHVELT
jgi:hypothetical protein